MQEEERSQLAVLINKPEKNPRGRAAILFSLLALVVALGSSALQFHSWHLNQLNQTKLKQQARNFETVLTEKVNRQQQMLKSIIAFEQDEKRMTLNNLEEAAHLVNLAQYNLIYDYNIELAIKLLSDANDKLKQSNNPGLNSLRISLTNDLANLQAIPKLDIPMVLAQLSAMSTKVATLANVPIISQNVQIKPTQPVHTNWKEKLWAVLHSLKGIVTIRRLPEPIQPLASPEQQIYLVESIRLQFTEAEWAVLHHDQPLFQASLERAKKQLQTWYAKNSEGQQLLQMIGQLQGLTIRPPVPDLKNTLSQLNTYLMEVRQSVKAPAALPPQINSTPVINPPTASRAIPS